MNSCTLRPQGQNIKTKEWSKDASQLFDQLLSITGKGRDNFLVAMKNYTRIKNPLFLQYHKDISLNDQGEPTLEEFLKLKEVRNTITDSKIIDYISRNEDSLKNSSLVELSDTRQNTRVLMQQALAFNKESKFKNNYVAILNYKTNDDNEKVVFIQLLPKNEKNNRIFEDQFTTLSLNTALSKILQSIGLNIGQLEDLEYTLGGRVGVTDFSNAVKAARGLADIIKVANNMEGEFSIPEEFSHLFVELYQGNPLVGRALNSIIANNLEEVILGDQYLDTVKMYEDYDNKQILIAKEALGKVLAQEINKAYKEQNSLYKESSTKTLVSRLWNYIKNSLRNINPFAVDDAINSVKGNLSQFAKNLLNENQQITKKQISSLQNNIQFNNLSDSVKRNMDILKKANEVESKKYLLLTKRKTNSSIEESALKNEIIDLRNKIASGDAAEGLFNYMQNGIVAIRDLDKQLSDIDNMSPRSAFGALRRINNFINSYTPIIAMLQDALSTDKDELSEEENIFLQQVNGQLTDTTLEKVLRDFNDVVRELQARYYRKASSKFAKFLEGFVGKNVTIRMEGKDTEITIEDLLKQCHNDISFASRWLDSMADSNDPLLNIFEQVVKKAGDNTRYRTVQMVQQMQVAAEELRAAGITDFEFMFEKDSKGNKSGYYISDEGYNRALYNEAEEAIIKELNEEYGENPSGGALIQKKARLKQWKEDNREYDGLKWIPSKTKYPATKLNDAQKRFYNKFMTLKKSADSLLPDSSVSERRAIAIRKDLIDRVKASNSINGALHQFTEAIKDGFVTRADDDMFGMQSTMQDFENKEVQLLPIYYTKLGKGETPNDLSTDIVSTFAAYANMAINFDELDKVIDALETGRTIVSKGQRKTVSTNNGESKMEQFEALGEKIVNKALKNTSEGFNWEQRLSDFFESQIYGRYLKDEGSFKIGNSEIKKAKVTSKILGLSSIIQLGFNGLANLANAATGIAMLNIEAVAGEFFKASTLAKADGVYTKELGGFLGDLGNRAKNNKLDLFDELFNIKQEFKSKITQKDYNKGFLGRFFGSRVQFLGQEAGDHWLYNRVAIAAAMEYKLTAPDGTQTTLWETLQPILINNKISTGGKKLSLPFGYTKEDGTKFSKEDIGKFSRYVGAINQHLFGIYNEEDSNAASRISMGRMVMQYRKWMRPQWNKRFASKKHNYDLGMDVEGYYSTVYNTFIKGIYDDLKNGQYNIAARWQDIKGDKHKMANFKRAMTEITQFLALLALLGLCKFDDDKDRPYALKLTEYMLRRLKTELGTLVPLPTMITEGVKIMDDPVAAATTIKNTVNLVGLFNPYNYMDEIENGKFKDHSSAYRIFMKSPLTGWYGTIDRVVTADAKFYEQQ